MYVKVTNGKFLIVSIYVNDMIITRNKIELIKKFKNEMKKVFEMINHRVMKYFLRMELLQFSNAIFIFQQKYILNTLNRFKMQDSKFLSTPISTSMKQGKMRILKK